MCMRSDIHTVRHGNISIISIFNKLQMLKMHNYGSRYSDILIKKKIKTNTGHPYRYPW